MTSDNAKTQSETTATEPAKSDGRTEVTLPVSGTTARVRPALGRDSIMAGRLVSASDLTNMMAQQMAILAQCVTIDGQSLAYEDIQDWPLADVYAVLPVAMSGGKSVSSLAETLLASSSTQGSA